MNHNQITEVEHVRDYALRAVFGNWDYLKNRSAEKEEYARVKLQWVSPLGGKRESRRLMGDVVLCEQDLLQAKTYDDASFTTTWAIDLHYPKEIEGFAEEPYRSYCKLTRSSHMRFHTVVCIREILTTCSWQDEISALHMWPWVL
jgi:hypothetical protein